ncbi:MAG: hypothetical protein AVDCRST_MAG71-652 [uncultured Lysobacter sp.]|uniref:Uncharacterized protein n=1 Tax=uncultured Lysobacter sp. TaxID=271060 RepID=A0A6J4KPA1_9GAMM|nr:MAG: hypothetical protein AVDCRST_MAG71-652 [uncultured Lysobacter sp.]
MQYARQRRWPFSDINARDACDAPADGSGCANKWIIAQPTCSSRP